MPRIARIVFEGMPHHVTQRGNNRRTVFAEDKDYRFYLRLLAEKLADSDVTLAGYCLMPNHVHLLLTPVKNDSLARFIARFHHAYSLYFNEKNGRSGHLWQSRFFSCPVEDRILDKVLRYIECNPVRAGICSRAWEYRWSSAAAHGGFEADKYRVLDLDGWKEVWNHEEWKAMLSMGDDQEQVKKIRSSTMTGRPFAGRDFLQRLELRTGRSFNTRPVGRPKKN